MTRELVTDSLGEALFQNIPSGRYKFRAKAANHQEVAGRLIIKPGITLNQAVFLGLQPDHGRMERARNHHPGPLRNHLNATFETDVPAAVVMMQPTSINLPKMAVGDKITANSP